MARAQRFCAKTEALDGAGGEVLDEHIGARQELFQDARCRGVLDVQREALLRAVGPDEVRRLALHRAVVSAGRIAAARSLDLDDARAELGELARGERPGDHLLERYDGDAFERSHANSRVRPASDAPVMRVLQISPGAP